MGSNNRTLLPLEKRLALAASSQAVSPEAAARLVQRLSRLHTALLFGGRADHDLMVDLTGEFWPFLEDDLLHYGGFCRSFQLAIENDFRRLADPEGPPDPCQPVLGVRVNNAVVLLGLILLDHAKGRRRDRDIYHCTRMTLGQYLDALDTLAFRGNRPPDQRFRTWRDLFLRSHDRATPLGDALGDILRHYIAGWQVFGQLERILCGADLEGAEAANAQIPDPSGKDVAPGAVRSQIFLSARDYSSKALKALCAQSPSPELRVLREKYLSEARLAFAMGKINTAMTDLYMLWVEPYLRMEECRDG